jgi:hypothetical protein
MELRGGLGYFCNVKKINWVRGGLVFSIQRTYKIKASKAVEVIMKKRVRGGTLVSILQKSTKASGE